MSAISATIQKDRIILLSDAAIYRHDGTLAALENKVLALPFIESGVFGSRGHAEAFALFPAAVMAVAPATWDEFSERFIDVIAAYKILRDAVHPHCRAQFLIAGWSSNRNQGEVLYWSDDDYLDLPGETAMEWTGEAQIALGIMTSDMGDPKAFLPAVHGVAAFTASRQHETEIAPGTWGFGIGGRIDAATITRTGVTRETIHEWPDLVGNCIVPEAAIYHHKAVA